MDCGVYSARSRKSSASVALSRHVCSAPLLLLHQCTAPDPYSLLKGRKWKRTSSSLRRSGSRTRSSAAQRPCANSSARSRGVELSPPCPRRDVLLRSEPLGPGGCHVSAVSCLFFAYMQPLFVLNVGSPWSVRTVDSRACDLSRL